MDLQRRTLDALDWPYVLDALAEQTRTEAGAWAARNLEPAGGLTWVRAVMDAVDEAAVLRDGEAGSVRVGGVEDISAHVRRAARGLSLDKAELRNVGSTITALAELREYLDRHAAIAPTLAEWGEQIAIDAPLRTRLARAFDTRGELSETAYPVLGELRRKIAALERRARALLEELLGGDTLADYLQDSYVTVRSDRLVIPVKAQAKNLDIGIVHDASRSGQTVYIEPRQVVPVNNERRVAEAELAAEERRILQELSKEVGRHAYALYAALEAATQIDLAAARADLARRLGATRPQVGEDGCIELRAARHPVLLLDGVGVVPNDLTLTGTHPVLVLTGPNAGGKTIALKTLGLAAQLVRVGCFVPAAEGSRVDYFEEVLADIGDQQSVHGGLSSFSGHLTCLYQMYLLADRGSLLLLDELASGTDPTQGGALARALVERFADAGARVVTTTHYAQVKAMGVSDSRVAVAAMEYLDDRPTYRVIEGMAGESHALSVAAHVGFDTAIIDRARALMDEGERALHDALASLEQEQAHSQELTRRLEDAARTLDARESKLLAREQKIRERAGALEEEAAASFLERVRKADREIARVVANLQRNPTSRRAADARRALADERTAALAPTTPFSSVVGAGGIARASALAAGDSQGIADSASRPPAPPAEGERVRVTRMGITGEVVRVRDDELEIRTGNLTIRVAAADVVRVEAAGAIAVRAGSPSTRSKPSGRSRHAAADGEHSARAADGRAVRIDSNTIDLRGERVYEGLRKLESFLDSAIVDGHDSIFVLHGHGTGAMKQAVRTALAGSHYVADYGPADEDQGGDAFTVATLR